MKVAQMPADLIVSTHSVDPCFDLDPGGTLGLIDIQVYPGAKY
jgi:hypothetical protein